MSSLTDRYLELEFTLQPQKSLNEEGEEVTEQPVFSNGTPTRKVIGLRMLVNIENAAAIFGNQATMQIYGMNEYDMYKLSTFAKPYWTNPVEVKITAGTTNQGLTQIFQGVTYMGTIDYNAMPNVSITISAQSGYNFKVKPAAANSFPGEVDVAVIVQAIANQMDFSFKNHGVTVKLVDYVLSGDVMQQLRDVARAANIAYSLENNTIHIWPNDGSREDIPELISVETGLIGYPQFYPLGIVVSCEFNPNILLGRKVQVKSSIPQASGVWAAHSVSHNLTYEFPEGTWFTSFYGNEIGVPYVAR